MTGEPIAAAIDDPDETEGRQKCGCKYRSEAAPSVRKGHELGGYLIEACASHSRTRRFAAMPKEHSYDSACERLAEHFLGANAERDAVGELAQHVQDAVEDWLRDFDAYRRD